MMKNDYVIHLRSFEGGLEGSNVYQAQGGNLGVSACAEIGVSGGDLGDARYLKAVLLEKHQGGNEA